MKVFSVCGISGSGKTTTIEEIIKELIKRGYSVGSVKEIHFEAFQIDPVETSNTNRHKKAGASLVTARGYNETDILYPYKVPMYEILKLYTKFDWVVLEGVSDIPIPTIITGHDEAGLGDKWSEYAFAVSGRIAETIDSYQNKPAISAIKDIQRLVDLIEAKTYDLLPNFDSDCCDACGFSCATLGANILRGKAKRSDCVAHKGIKLLIDGKQILMVPFVEQILRNTILGVVSELDGYEAQVDIEIQL